LDYETFLMKAEGPTTEESKILDTKTSSEEEVVKASTNHKMRGPEFNGPAEYLYAFMLGGSRRSNATRSAPISKLKKHIFLSRTAR
jgi:hypothetical protein